MQDAADAQVAVADIDDCGRVGVHHDRRAVGVGGDGGGGRGAGQHGAAAGDQQRGAVVEEEFLGGGCVGQRADLVEIAEPDRGPGERVGGDGAGGVAAGLGAGDSTGLGDQGGGRDAAAGLIDVAGGLQVGNGCGRNQVGEVEVGDRIVAAHGGGDGDGDAGAGVLHRTGHGQAGRAGPAIVQFEAGGGIAAHGVAGE